MIRTISSWTHLKFQSKNISRIFSSVSIKEDSLLMANKIPTFDNNKHESFVLEAMKVLKANNSVDELEKKITDVKRREILHKYASFISKLSTLQLSYLELLQEEQIIFKKEKIHPITFSMAEELPQDDEVDQVYHPINYFLQQEALRKIWGNRKSSNFGQSGSSAGENAEAAIVEEVKEPEKTIFNVHLKSFDQAAKIKIIKELKTILNLSLKEAKDIVDRAPSQLKENVAKAEAEELRDKLSAFGWVIELN